MTMPSRLQQISDAVWELPADYKSGMRAPARIYGTREIIEAMDDGVFEQVSNVACLPGILKHACCLPDGHWGYGFPIGGAAAFDPDRGVISPGGIGFDINCGMRLVRTDLTEAEVKPRLHRLIDRLFERVPAGVGCTGVLKLKDREFRELVERGSAYCVEHGYGWPEDLERTEDRGCMPGADASRVSPKAVARGRDQVGTLGSGNHYLEIQVVRDANILDRRAAKAFGVGQSDQIVVMFHCGSRGFGHQIASDYLERFVRDMGAKYGIGMPDKQLACAPFRSRDGQEYFAAMACAVNMAFANRQVILHRIRGVFEEVFGKDARELGMHQVYDVSHNTAKLETQMVDGIEREILIHRKGATRAFAPGMKGVPEPYRTVGQPAIIGGSMETGSYLLTGMESGSETFYTTAHGSGRTMSRKQAKRQFNGRQLQAEMEKRGVYIRTSSYSGLAEEAGGAYKNIDDVAKATAACGVSKPVVRFVPLGNVKG